jgi:L-alanine-DL-glutamate epimerase-like enolase superfamily enzyme
MKLEVKAESWPYKVPFRVSRGAEAELGVIVVRLTEAGLSGSGEAAGVDYDGERVAGMQAQVEALRGRIEADEALRPLIDALPPGGARNALDCALWDLEAKKSGRSVFDTAGFPAPKSLISAVTFGIDSEEATRAAAERYHDWPLIKIKVDGSRHLQTVQLVRSICRQARFIVDPNQAWSCELLNELSAPLLELGVALIEQPVARGKDETLRHYKGRIPLAVDESLQDRRDLVRIKDFYQVANVKLDKTGGLTEALLTAREARSLGLNIMVGCMAGTSLAMAPGMVIGQMAEFVDLDGPLLHVKDREHGIKYHAGNMQLPDRKLWG